MSGRRSAAATALASAAFAALAAFVPATPALADPGLSVSVDAPSVDGAHATISGSVHMAGALDWVTSVHIDVSSPNAGASCDGCGATVNNGPSTSFFWTTPDFDYNGPYDVSVVATGQKILDVVTQASVRTESHAAFSVEIDPAPPADPTAAPNPDGSVTVSWARNSEPDLAGYQVLRRSGGSGYGVVAPAVPQADGSRIQWVDGTTKAGGQFEYQVIAVRPDGDGNVSERATSASATAPVTVVPAPAGQIDPGSPGAPGGPGAPGQPGALVAPGPGGAFTTGPPGSLDLSSFVSSGGASGGAPPGIAVPGGVTLPDGTFSPTLPFGARDLGEPGGGSVEILGRTTSRRNLLLPVAAGLLMCVAALHLRRFNRRVLAPPVEA